MYLGKTASGLFKILIAVFIMCSTGNLYAQVSMEIGAGSTVEISDGINIELTGNWQNNGSFICGKSSVSFTGPFAQFLSSGSEETFYNLTVNKSGKSLNSGNDIKVKNRLNLAQGILNASRSAVIVFPSGEVKRGTGYVIGSLMKKGLTKGNRIFETGTQSSYSPVEMHIESGSGDITVAAYEGAYSKVSGTTVLQRYWCIQNSGNSKGDIKLNYAGQDVTGIENSYVAGCFNDKWLFPKTVINSQNHSALIKNVIQAGDWTLGARDALYPSQISLKYSLNSNKIVVSWQVPSDYRNYSFTLERADYWLKDWKPVAGMDELQKGKYGDNFTYTDSPPTGKFRYRLKQMASDGDLLYSDDIEVTLDRPGSYSLEQNFPNPFNSETRINYSIPVDSKVYLVVFSVTGQIVAELVNEYKSAGRYSVALDASGLASGTYIYKISAGSFVQTKKMIILR